MVHRRGLHWRRECCGGQDIWHCWSRPCLSPKRDVCADTILSDRLGFSEHTTRAASQRQCRIRTSGLNVLDNIGAGPRNSSIRLRWLSESLSQDPFFQYSPFQQLSAAANWNLSWKIYWDSCTNGSSSVQSTSGTTFTESAQGSLAFTTKDGAQKPDLVSGTKDTSCSRNSGVAINITDSQGEGAETCAVVAAPSSVSYQTPCRVQIGSAAAASISSYISATLCRSVPVPTGCPMHNEEKKSTAQSLAVGSLAGFLVILSLLLNVLAIRTH
jgi:hypothetical protein